MDWNALRRVITENRGGRSRVLIDGGAASMIAAGGAGLAEIWQAAMGDGLLAGEDLLASAPVRLEPPAGALKVRWFTVPPEPAGADRAALEEGAAAAFAAVGAGEARVDVTRHPMMHKTRTLDIIILVRGEVELLLDEGDALVLKPGDVVVQRATNHAWVNRGTETALLVAVLIDGKASQ